VPLYVGNARSTIVPSRGKYKRKESLGRPIRPRILVSDCFQNKTCGLGQIGDGYLQISASSRAEMNWANLGYDGARMTEKEMAAVSPYAERDQTSITYGVHVCRDGWWILRV
jgi:hypothetical protein